jgi:hypothetical protein
MPITRYAGYDGGKPEPEPEPATPRPSGETSALRDENAALIHRVDQFERVLRSACHLLQPYSRPTPPRR